MDSTEMRSSPSRVTSASLPSGEMAAWLVPDLSSAIVTLPAGATVLPWMVKTDTVPSPRLATRASVPARLIETPAGALPVSSVAMIRGGEALRSTTDIVLFGMRLVGSAGSSFSLAVTSASDSSGETATLKGGPTTLPGTSSSATTFGGHLLMSMTVSVSGGGLFTTVAVPLTSVTLLSLVDSKSCPCATGTKATARSTMSATSRGVFMRLLRNVGRRGIEDQVRAASARYTEPHGARASVDGTARARRPPGGRSRNLLAAHAAAVPAQPHQPVAARGRPGLDHRRHGRRPRRHARAVGAHLCDASRRPPGPAGPRDSFSSRPHGQRRLAHRPLANRALVHAGRVALRAVLMAQWQRRRFRAAPRALPPPRLRPGRADAAR